MEEIQPILARFSELERLLAEHAARAQSPEYTGWLKEHARLSKTMTRWRHLESLQRQIADARTLLADPEMRASAEEELARLTPQEAASRTELEGILLDSDEPTVGSIILEVRPGTGGEEAALFAGDLYRMYSKYIQRRGWKLELIDATPSELGGVRQATLSVEGDDVWARLRFESGTHRVQRVPRTEASGRIHTSAATVAILPEVEEELKIEIRREDLRIDTYSAGGPGGQHVNKTASAVRLTHLPTGLVVACQVERSQIRNRDLAMRWMKARLAEKQRAENKERIDTLRRDQVGSGDRSEKIRTYNFPQSRITDHRVHFSLHNLEKYLDGEIDEMIDAMIADDRARKKAAAKK